MRDSFVSTYTFGILICQVYHFLLNTKFNMTIYLAAQKILMKLTYIACAVNNNFTYCCQF